METPSVTRNITSVICNDLPPSYDWGNVEFNFRIQFGAAPPMGTNHLIIDVRPACTFIESGSGKILFIFQTSSAFQFENKYPKQQSYELIYQLILEAIKDFNSLLKEQWHILPGPILYRPNTFEECYPNIDIAFGVNMRN